MKKAVIVNSVLAVCLVGAVGFIGLAEKNSPRVGEAAVMGDDDSQNLKYANSSVNSELVALLNTQDVSWQAKSYDTIREYEELMSETEQQRRDLEEQKRDKQREFLQAQLLVAQEQQRLQEELEQKAKDAIAQQGGIGVTDKDYLDITDQMGAPNKVITPPGQSGGATPAPETSENPNVTSEPDAPEGYYGQFSVQLVCTCDSCFEPDKWPGYSVGANALLVDSTYIPSGVSVALTGGADVALTTSSYSGASGRNCIALIGDHSVAGAGNTVFPKISAKG